jgi:hypothetical protein
MESFDDGISRDCDATFGFRFYGLQKTTEIQTVQGKILPSLSSSPMLILTWKNSRRARRRHKFKNSFTLVKRNWILQQPWSCGPRPLFLFRQMKRKWIVIFLPAHLGFPFPPSESEFVHEDDGYKVFAPGEKVTHCRKGYKLRHLFRRI